MILFDIVKEKANESKRLFVLNKDSIKEDNAHSLAAVSFIVFCLFLLVYILECIFRADLVYEIISLCAAVLFALNSSLIANLKKKMSGAVLLVDYYAMVLLDAAVCISLDLFFPPYATCTTTVVVLIVFPSVFIDRLPRFFLCSLTIVGGYVATMFLCGNNPLWFRCVIILSVCAVLGVIFGGFTNRSKIRSINANRILLIDRDMDVLTGIRNRRALFALLDRECVENEHMDGIIMLDVDLFKLYNDFYGHQMGDDCLKAIGKQMNDFGKENFCEFFRYGGEEFVAVVRYCNEKKLQTLSNKFLDCVRNLDIVHEKSPYGVVTVSIGCAFKDDGFIDYEKLIGDADKALYKAKGEGRNQAVLYRSK